MVVSGHRRRILPSELRENAESLQLEGTLLQSEFWRSAFE